MMDKTAIIIFRKNLIPGQVKTRLSAVLGENKAVEIYEKLVKRSLEACNKVKVDKYLFYSDYMPSESLLLPGYHHRIQAGKDLGERMRNALFSILEKGYSRVLLIGTDCVDLTPDILKQGLELLKENEVVLGPAEDGGYYLVGLSLPVSEIFLNMTWSTNTVFEETINRLEKMKKKYGVLPRLLDVDYPEDWEKVKHKFE